MNYLINIWTLLCVLLMAQLTVQYCLIPLKQGYIRPYMRSRGGYGSWEGPHRFIYPPPATKKDWYKSGKKYSWIPWNVSVEEASRLPCWQHDWCMSYFKDLLSRWPEAQSSNHR